MEIQFLFGDLQINPLFFSSKHSFFLKKNGNTFIIAQLFADDASFQEILQMESKYLPPNSDFMNKITIKKPWLIPRLYKVVVNAVSKFYFANANNINNKTLLSELNEVFNAINYYPLLINSEGKLLALMKKIIENICNISGNIIPNLSFNEQLKKLNFDKEELTRKLINSEQKIISLTQKNEKSNEDIKHLEEKLAGFLAILCKCGPVNYDLILSLIHI